jgi:phosphoribosylamine-glycine ligase
MTSRIRNLALAAGLVVTLCGSAFAGKNTAPKNVAVGTITSIDANHVVINQKVNGTDQSVTYMLNGSTHKTGTLAAGTRVRVRYRTENNQNIATAVRVRTGRKHKKAA